MIAGQLRYQWKNGKHANLPASMTEQQRSLIHLMAKVNPLERVRMAFVVDRLNEIVHEDNAMRAL